MVSYKTKLFMFQVVAGVCYVYYSWSSPLVRSIFGVSLIILSFFIPIFILV